MSIDFELNDHKWRLFAVKLRSHDEITDQGHEATVQDIARALEMNPDLLAASGANGDSARLRDMHKAVTVEAGKKSTSRGATAEALWQLLDDIDTASDQIKPEDIISHRLFYRRVLDIASRRHLLLKSDGYTLTWPESGDSIERGGYPPARVFPAGPAEPKSNYAFHEIPERDPLIYQRYEDLKRVVEGALQGKLELAGFPGHAELAKRIVTRRILTGLPKVPVVPGEAATESGAPLVRTEADSSYWKSRYEDLTRALDDVAARQQPAIVYEKNQQVVNAVRVALNKPAPDLSPGGAPEPNPEYWNRRFHDLERNVSLVLAGERVQPEYQDTAHMVNALRSKIEAPAPVAEPVPMLLSCPVCHARHVDVGEFAKKPHRDHSCQACGVTWRPAKVPTVGVQFLPGYRDELSGVELVGKRVRVLRPLEPSMGFAPPGATYLVTKFDGPYGDVNQELYHVLVGTSEMRLLRNELEAL
jgi:hypothetical protein